MVTLDLLFFIRKQEVQPMRHPDCHQQLNVLSFHNLKQVFTIVYTKPVLYFLKVSGEKVYDERNGKKTNFFGKVWSYIIQKMLIITPAHRAGKACKWMSGYFWSSCQAWKLFTNFSEKDFFHPLAPDTYWTTLTVIKVRYKSSPGFTWFCLTFDPGKTPPSFKLPKLRGVSFYKSSPVKGRDAGSFELPLSFDEMLVKVFSNF